MSNRRVSFAPLALGDLDEVLQYTLQRWGEEQQISYGDLLMTGIDRLAQFPGLVIPCGQLRPGLYFQLVEQHKVLYLYDDARLTVVRILHMRMDEERLDW